MPRVSRVIAALAGLALTACAGSVRTDVSSGLNPVNPNASQIRVMVYRGVSGTEVEVSPSHLVVDVTPLLPTGTKPAPDSDLTAEARQMLRQLRVERDGESERVLHPFHRAERLAAPDSCTGGAHASAALTRLRENLEREDALDGARVVLITDLATECAPRLCDTASALLADGAWLDVVQVGRGRAPACIADLEPNARQPASLAKILGSEEPAFRVETPASDGSATVVARGIAGSAVEVPPGFHMVVVDVEPAEVVGPVRVGPGQRATVQLMDFPLSAPDAREWRIEVEDARP